MKKLMLVLLCMAVFVSLAMAQNPTYTSGSGITGVDKLGAHQNGGRGCTGCHAPHSGGAGAGGNIGSGTTVDPNMGNDALWGQDMGPLYGYMITQGDGATPSGPSTQSGLSGTYVTTLPASLVVADELSRGVMMCLSCHDGNIAKGAMMQNASWEQANQLLPTGLYGTKAIPTLLGNDGTAAGNYANDHPIGPQATLKAVGVSSNFTYNATGCTWHGVASPCLKVNTAKTNYVNFAAHYGAPSIISNGHGSPVAMPTTNPDDAYVVCTTCHTPHSMYTASANADAPINGLTAGTYPSYFFIAAPYNPGSKPTSQQASSATQFCRQCHFQGAGGANEASGINNVTTAF